jgi:hypothetical protein
LSATSQSNSASQFVASVDVVSFRTAVVVAAIFVVDEFAVGPASVVSVDVAVHYAVVEVVAVDIADAVVVAVGASVGNAVGI